MSQHSLPNSISPMSRYRPPPKHPSYHGPTSSAFSLDVAKTTLHNMGYQVVTDEVNTEITTQSVTPLGSPPAMAPSNTNGHQLKDPIWELTKDEMIRLCRVYEEEMGLMYPVLDIEQLIIHGSNLYDFIDAALRSGLANTTSPGQGVKDQQSCILKMVLACAMATEGSGQSDVADRLFENVREAADHALHSEVIEIKSLPFLALVVGQNHLCYCFSVMMLHLL